MAQKYFCRNIVSCVNKALKLRCDERFTHGFTACGCVFQVIILVWVNQRNFFENATARIKRMGKTHASRNAA